VKALCIYDPPEEVSPPHDTGTDFVRPDLSEEEIRTGLTHILASINQTRLPFLILIEDDEHDATLFRSALRKAQVAVEFMHFRDGQQALDFFHGRGAFADRDMYPLPHLIVLDFKLTRSSGLQILAQIRSTPSLDQLGVIGLSASEDIHEIEHAHRLRINEYIKKPQHLTTLVEIVQRLKTSWLDSRG
jgi:two-component system response regulator